MSYGRILHDMFASIFSKSVTLGKDQDKRQFNDLCEALLVENSEVTMAKLANSILNKYSEVSQADKCQFFRDLTDNFDISTCDIVDAVKDYDTNDSSANLYTLLKATEPRRQELLRRLNLVSGATEQLVRMRTDLLDLTADNPEISKTDIDFQHLFMSWFNRGFLMIRPINWSTPAEILEKIIAYEAVHTINDWDDLRRRLLPSDRRCFAFFHPSMPTEPLIFVQVALCEGIPQSIQTVLAEDRPELSEMNADTAVFYSISSCQRGLKGISFGSFLIKQVVEELSNELANVKTFVTLSPVPGFMKWLTGQAREQAKSNPDGEINQLYLAINELSVQQWTEQGEQHRDRLMKLAATYFLTAKDKLGKPLDPVARFHLGNGAILKQINWLADLSDKGLGQSSGIMVNYLYDLSSLEANHEAYSNTNKVAVTKGITALQDH